MFLITKISNVLASLPIFIYLYDHVFRFVLIFNSEKYGFLTESNPLDGHRLGRNILFLDKPIASRKYVLVTLW